MRAGSFPSGKIPPNMADQEEDKQVEKAASVAKPVCMMTMQNGWDCGRPLHDAPLGVDEKPVCLMHSEDPKKNDVAFQEEFEHILSEAGSDDADFMRFVFGLHPVVGQFEFHFL